MLPARTRNDVGSINPNLGLLERVHTHRSGIYSWKDRAFLKQVVSEHFDIQLKDARGLYWIYTKHTPQFLIQNSTPPKYSSQCDFSKQVQSYVELSSVIPAPVDSRAWWCVYSGIGGGPSGPLFQRISEHFTAKPSETKSCLAIGTQADAFNDETMWGLQVVLFTANALPFGVDIDYDTHALTLERGWRLEYGCPILCKS